MRSSLSERMPSVERVRLEWYADLGVHMSVLKDFGSKAESSSKLWVGCVLAGQALEALLVERETSLQIPASRPVIERLLVPLNAYIGSTDRQEAFVEQRHAIGYLASQLAVILNGELGIQNCYLVLPKRAYDIKLLADDALRLFSDKVRAGLNDIERYDIVQAGRCLAFEVPTAAMFHMFRAADSVLRRWYEKVVGTVPAVKARNWGSYIRTLRKFGADEKILSALDQIKDLHRNPVIHPEIMVSIEGALSFVGIAESIISGMVTDIQRLVEGSAMADLFAGAGVALAAPNALLIAAGPPGGVE